MRHVILSFDSRADGHPLRLVSLAGSAARGGLLLLLLLVGAARAQAQKVNTSYKVKEYSALTRPAAAQGPVLARHASRPDLAAVSTTGPAALAVGTWTGTLPIAGRAVAVSLAITRQDGTYSASLDIPGGAVRQRRLRVTERADTLHLRETTFDVQFTCAVSPDGQRLSGLCAWAQLGGPMAMAFHRGAAAEAANAGPRAGRTAYATPWEQGTLENDQPVGVWNYYQKDAAGGYVLLRTYDHTARGLAFAPTETEPFDAELRPGVWERTVLSQAPWFIGRHDALSALSQGLAYPPQARQRRVEGKVWVSFVIDTLGRVSDHRVLKGLGSGCDEEALRVARTIPDTWTPGRLGTKAVACRKTLLFVFEL